MNKVTREALFTEGATANTRVLPSFNCSPKEAAISALVEFLERVAIEVVIVFVFKRFVIKR
jgi:hypothetical protein